MEVALIGTGYWGSKIAKYIDEFFYFKIGADSKLDLELIWSDEKIKSVIIATPIDTHYDLCKEALYRGKNVFIEKPVTVKYEDALDLMQIAKDTGLKVGVDYVQTFSPAIKTIQDLVADLSPIKYIEMSTKHLGRFMDQDVYKLLASHHLSILALFTDISKIKVANKDHMYYNGYCTSGSLLFDLGRIDVSLNYPGKEMCMTLYGEDWTIKYTPLEVHSVTYTKYNKEFAALPDKLTVHEETYIFDESNNLRYALKYFKHLIEGKEVSNLSNAAHITRILEDLN